MSDVARHALTCLGSLGAGVGAATGTLPLSYAVMTFVAALPVLAYPYVDRRFRHREERWRHEERMATIAASAAGDRLNGSARTLRHLQDQPRTDRNRLPDLDHEDRLKVEC